MTKVKFCGLTCDRDITYVNALYPDYIGFVFAKKSKRYIDGEKAKILRKQLHSDIIAVGVFVDEEADTVADLLRDGTIDIAQLHGMETEEYIEKLRRLSDKPIIKAFSIRTMEDILRAQKSTADYVLLDASEAGSGKVFDWELLKEFHRPYFLAGGLNAENVADAIAILHPYAVDVSSGIESDGRKSKDRMQEFLNAVKTGKDKER